MRDYLPRGAPARTALVAALVLIAVLAAWSGWRAWQLRSGATEIAGAGLLGGDFALTDQHGDSRRDSDFRGRFMLVYFGFVNCPDICPATLQVMSAALDRLGEDAERIAPLFITVDPVRDTPDALKAYAANFHPRLVALTGDQAAIAALARAYSVYYDKAAGGDATDYQINHSSIVYLMGPDGRYLTHTDASASPEALADAIRAYL